MSVVKGRQLPTARPLNGAVEVSTTSLNVLQVVYVGVYGGFEIYLAFKIHRFDHGLVFSRVWSFLLFFSSSLPSAKRVSPYFSLYPITY